MYQQKWKDKAKSEIPEKFKERKRTCQKKWEDMAKYQNVSKFESNKKKANQTYYKQVKMKGGGSLERLKRFRQATRYGPIFVCSSCHQKLFEYEVVHLEESFQDEVNTNHNG